MKRKTRNQKSQKSTGLNVALSNGSLKDGTTCLFGEANLKIYEDPRRHDAWINDPLISRVTFMRPQHIPDLVTRGFYDVGICGLDCQYESSAGSYVIAELPYGRGTSTGKAKIVLVTSKSNPAKSIEDVEEGAVILSEYPHLTESWYENQSLTPPTVRFSYGGTEAHIPRDYRYGVCLTETGASLKANKLKVIHTFMETYTCMIVNQDIWTTTVGKPKEHPKKKLVMALEHLLLGTLAAWEQVFLVMNVSKWSKDALLQHLPSLKKPTVTPLADGNYFSVGAVVYKGELNALLPALFASGAQDLVEMPISKVIRSWS